MPLQSGRVGAFEAVPVNATQRPPPLRPALCPLLLLRLFSLSGVKSRSGKVTGGRGSHRSLLGLHITDTGESSRRRPRAAVRNKPLFRLEVVWAESRLTARSRGLRCQCPALERGATESGLQDSVSKPHWFLFVRAATFEPENPLCDFVFE